MRNIFINANTFGLSNGNNITITLLNKIGQELTTTYKGQLINFNKTLEIVDDKLEVELYENNLLPNDSYYEIVIKNIKFKFIINSDIENKSHELTSLLQLGSNDEVAYIHNDKLIFEIDFIKKIDIKLSGLEPYFTENQERVFNFFCFYADYIINSNLTIDISKKIDELLFLIVEILSPQYVAVENFVGKSVEDNKQKATDLLQALNDLQSINTQSKEYMSETQTIVKQAIEDAMKKALIFG